MNITNDFLFSLLILLYFLDILLFGLTLTFHITECGFWIIIGSLMLFYGQVSVSLMVVHIIQELAMNDSEASKFVMFLHFPHMCIWKRSPLVERRWTWLVVALRAIKQSRSTSSNLIPLKCFRSDSYLLIQLTLVVTNIRCVK